MSNLTPEQYDALLAGLIAQEEEAAAKRKMAQGDALAATPRPYVGGSFGKNFLASFIPSAAGGFYQDQADQAMAGVRKRKEAATRALIDAIRSAAAQPSAPVAGEQVAPSATSAPLNPWKLGGM